MSHTRKNMELGITKCVGTNKSAQPKDGTNFTYSFAKALYKI